MPDTLKALYYGNIAPFEVSIPAGSPVRQLMLKLSKCEDALAALLDEEGKPLLKDFTGIQQQINSTTAEENFILGFRLGVQIMAECLTEKEVTPDA